jgi:hypothetical protein
MTTSLAVGDIASTLICGGAVEWIEAGAFSPEREELGAFRGATIDR